MKSKTLERFKNQEFYIKCNTKDENLMIRHICEENGLQVLFCWGTFVGHSNHYLSYGEIGGRWGKALFASMGNIENFVSADKFIRKVEEEMKNGKFTKDMLVSGRHVVKRRDGRLALYLNGKFHVELHSNISDSYYNDLESSSGSNYDIVEVFEANNITFLEGYFNEYNLTSVWVKTQETTEAEKQLIEAKELLFKAHKAIEEAETKIAEERQ